jgi:hypothetical protein
MTAHFGSKLRVTLNRRYLMFGTNGWSPIPEVLLSWRPRPNQYESGKKRLAYQKVDTNHILRAKKFIMRLGEGTGVSPISVGQFVAI